MFYEKIKAVFEIPIKSHSKIYLTIFSVGLL